MAGTCNKAPGGALLPAGAGASTALSMAALARQAIRRVHLEGLKLLFQAYLLLIDIFFTDAFFVITALFPQV